MMQDIAILTGGEAIFKDLGMALEKVTLSQLGVAKQGIVTTDDTTRGIRKQVTVQVRQHDHVEGLRVHNNLVHQVVSKQGLEGDVGKFLCRFHRNLAKVAICNWRDIVFGATGHLWLLATFFRSF